jgi:hypothetical protein
VKFILETLPLVMQLLGGSYYEIVTVNLRTIGRFLTAALNGDSKERDSAHSTCTVQVDELSIPESRSPRAVHCGSIRVKVYREK